MNEQKEAARGISPLAVSEVNKITEVGKAFNRHESVIVADVLNCLAKHQCSVTGGIHILEKAKEAIGLCTSLHSEYVSGITGDACSNLDVTGNFRLKAKPY